MQSRARAHAASTAAELGHDSRCAGGATTLRPIWSRPLQVRWRSMCLTSRASTPFLLPSRQLSYRIAGITAHWQGGNAQRPGISRYHRCARASIGVIDHAALRACTQCACMEPRGFMRAAARGAEDRTRILAIGGIRSNPSLSADRASAEHHPRGGCTRAMVEPYGFKNEINHVKNTYELATPETLVPIENPIGHLHRPARSVF